MFDYRVSKHAHFDDACKAFVNRHNLTELAALMGTKPQILRNKFNPEQPHKLTCEEVLLITDLTPSRWHAGTDKLPAISSGQ